MIIGPFIDAGSVLVGGIVGALIGKWVKPELRQTLMVVFGVPSIAMGVIYTVKTVNLPAVIIAVSVGVIIGELIHLEGGITLGGRKLNLLMNKVIPESFRPDIPEDEFLNKFVAILVLFCASGTGIFGAMNEGMTGDHSVLLAKSVLDLFTAAIFATNLRFSTATICIPQVIILLILAFAGSYIVPLTDASMRADFTGVGGVLMLANGFRIADMKKFPVASMLPAMVLAMPVSALWTNLMS